MDDCTVRGESLCIRHIICINGWVPIYIRNNNIKSLSTSVGFVIRDDDPRRAFGLVGRPCIQLVVMVGGGVYWRLIRMVWSGVRGGSGSGVV